MVLEATMICIDTSEWMRNGDYSPTRFQAQADAVNLICGAKTQSNPENTVGVLTMGGKGVRVLVTATSDLGMILACMHGLEIGGEMNLTAGIQVAHLTLKHRQNKNQQQRIIVFAGGPVKYDKKTLEAIGKKLKKNSVSLDVVDFGETEDEKSERLEALVAAVNNNGNSHIVHVPPGPSALSDVLVSTPVFTGDGDRGGGFAAAAAAGGMSGYDFGVDPNIDPELTLALRVSMEEVRARQEAAAKKAAEDAAKQEKGAEPTSSSHDAAVAKAVSSSALPTEEKRHAFTGMKKLYDHPQGGDPNIPFDFNPMEYIDGMVPELAAGYNPAAGYNQYPLLQGADSAGSSAGEPPVIKNIIILGGAADSGQFALCWRIGNLCGGLLDGPSVRFQGTRYEIMEINNYNLINATDPTISVKVVYICVDLMSNPKRDHLRRWLDSCGEIVPDALLAVVGMNLGDVGPGTFTETGIMSMAICKQRIYINGLEDALIMSTLYRVHTGL